MFNPLLADDLLDDTRPTEGATPDERDVLVLEAIAGAARAGDRPAQRDIAHAVGLSLGMTNAILKRLAKKGFVTMQRINGRTIHYLVTPDGIDLIARRSYRYLRRTVGHVVRYKERLRAALHRFRQEGGREVLLVGESDLDFLVEWCAHAEGLRLNRADEAPAGREDSGRTLVLDDERLTELLVRVP